MGDYPPNEIVDMIRQVGRAEDNYFLAARFYAEKYPNKRHPNRKTIKRLCTRAESGSLKRERRKSGAGEVKSTVIVAAPIVEKSKSIMVSKNRRPIEFCRLTNSTHITFTCFKN